MKKLRKKNHGRGNQSVHGETTFAAVTGTTVAGGTTIAAGQTTVAPTNLNTQFTKATTV
uniref:Uncharacterized protein n=1 Tax=Panagrolaimus sp. ES5 TaxID=591445 RepID=A0AC34GHC4_9BILA